MNSQNHKQLFHTYTNKMNANEMKKKNEIKNEFKITKIKQNK